MQQTVYQCTYCNVNDHLSHMCIRRCGRCGNPPATNGHFPAGWHDKDCLVPAHLIARLTHCELCLSKDHIAPNCAFGKVQMPDKKPITMATDALCRQARQFIADTGHSEERRARMAAVLAETTVVLGDSAKEEQQHNIDYKRKQEQYEFDRQRRLAAKEQESQNVSRGGAQAALPRAADSAPKYTQQEVDAIVDRRLAAAARRD